MRDKEVMSLMNETKNVEIAHTVTEARGLWQRMKGLIGTKSLDKSETLWIKRCNSIHTYFMSFPIDLAFVDKNLVVKSVYTQTQPWKVIFPIWKASSVFEFNSGVLSDENISVGDKLNVDC